MCTEGLESLGFFYLDQENGNHGEGVVVRGSCFCLSLYLFPLFLFFSRLLLSIIWGQTKRHLIPPSASGVFSLLFVQLKKGEKASVTGKGALLR